MSFGRIWGPLLALVLIGACAAEDGGSRTDTVANVPTSEPPEPGPTDPEPTDREPAEPQPTQPTHDLRPAPDPKSSTTDPAPTSLPAEAASPPPGVHRPEVEAAVADLAARLGVDIEAIGVVEVREVNWPDGSLGCPQPGMSYIQQILNGQLVVLETRGGRYEYHSGPRRPLFYCPNPTPPADMGFGTRGPDGS